MGPDLDALRAQTAQALERLRGLATDAQLHAARELAPALCKARLFNELGLLTEAIGRWLPRDAQMRRLYGQALIEQGYVTAAIDVLKALAARLKPSDPEHAEATGLLGRAWKQIFFDAGDKTADAPREALKQAIAIYRKPYEDNAANTWHGVNLLALVTRARRLGLRFAPELQPEALARQIITTLDAVPVGDRNEWHLPTRAEVLLGLDDLSAVEEQLKAYVGDVRAGPFTIASTLRQFTQVWDIEAVDARGRALADILRARLLEVGGGELTLTPAQLQRARKAADPPSGQLEAVLGSLGTKTWRWWKTGLERASAICSVRTKVGDRMGTGWLVRAGSLGREPADELLVVTNFHVVNAQGANNGIPPESAQIVFEAVDANKCYDAKEIVYSSPPDRLDCTLLRLAEAPAGITPLPVAKVLPLIDDTARVYLIGHPGGRDLAFSMQDNELIDHEGPPKGKPAMQGVCRVHYRAPTEGGSSGSPVFNSVMWEVIALHHSGGKLGMPRLNGLEGTYAANEGIWIQSIVAAQRL